MEKGSACNRETTQVRERGNTKSAFESQLAMASIAFLLCLSLQSLLSLSVFCPSCFLPRPCRN